MDSSVIPSVDANAQSKQSSLFLTHVYLDEDLYVTGCFMYGTITERSIAHTKVHCNAYKTYFDRLA